MALDNQTFANLERDISDTGEAVNEKKVINPRYGDPFKSLPLVAEEAEMKADEVAAKGFYLGFANEAAMRAYTPSFAETRAKLDDTKKVYRWERTSDTGVTPITGIWYDTGLSELDQAKAHFETEKPNILNQANESATSIARIESERNIAQSVKTISLRENLHEFTDVNGNIVAKIEDNANLDVVSLTIQGQRLDTKAIDLVNNSILKQENSDLHNWADDKGNFALSLKSSGRLIGAKPFDLGIDALFANATNNEELVRIGLYHDLIKASNVNAYKFTKLVYEINEINDGKTNEIASRMPSIIQVAKNKIFVSYALYREGALADQTHAAMVGRFVTFDTKSKTAIVDTNTVLMAGDRESNVQAHRHAAFAKVLNKETGKFRYICLFNRGTLRLNDSELNLIYSDDDCKTWSAIQTIMTESQPEPFYLIPCTLVEIPHGTFKGRLVTGVFRQTQNETSSEIAVLFSDDQGVTWKIGGKLQSGAFDQYGTFGFLNETMITVDNQGNLLFGIRNENSTLLESRIMLWARSYDGGNTILVEDEPHLVTALAEGSLVQAASHLYEGIPKILYSYPSAPVVGANAYSRRNPKIAVSYNNGKAFQVQYAVRPGTNVVTGYSHLIRTSDQDFILVEETSGKIELTFLNMSEILTNGVITNV